MGHWKLMVSTGHKALCALLPLFIVNGIAVSSSAVQLLDQVTIRNVKGDLCTFTATEPGQYRLSGLARRPWYQQYCTVYIRSPPNTRIRLTLDLNYMHCDRSILTVYDGWRVFDWLKKKYYSLPDDKLESSERSNYDVKSIDACARLPSDTSDRRVSIETSQNAGQIYHSLDRDESAIVNVQFIDDDRMCSVFMVDRVDGLYKISNNGKAGVCKWYVSGAVIVTLHEVHLQSNIDEPCEESSNFLQIQSSSLSWRQPDVKLESFFCQSEEVKLDHLLPCKFNRIELHTIDAPNSGEQWVTFTLQRPTDFEKEPYTYYCL